MSGTDSVPTTTLQNPPADPPKTEPSLANTTPPTTTPEPTKTNEPAKSLVNEKTEKTEVKGAPEKYEPFKAPEGLTFAEESLAKATPIFKELGLSQEAAQKLMDVYAQEVLALNKASAESVQTQQKAWRDEITKDSTYGDGNGKLKPTVTKAIADVKAQLPPDIRAGFEEAMDFTGVGNHPAFIRALNHLASKLTEGGHVAGNGPTKGSQTPPGKPGGPGPAALYPDLKPAATGG